MKPAALVLFLLIAICPPGRAQTTPGVDNEWDVKTLLDSLAGEAARLKPILDQLKPQDWVNQGAPDGYMMQSRVAQNEVGYLMTSAQNLQQQPERLTLALDVYFRMLAMESTLNSLVEGIRKYHNPAIADLLKDVMRQNSTNREKLKLYVVDLAGTKEQEFKIVDEEAQRCRGVLSRQTPKPAPAVRKPVQENK
jgi:hypothetical protein